MAKKYQEFDLQFVKTVRETLRADYEEEFDLQTINLPLDSFEEGLDIALYGAIDSVAGRLNDTLVRYFADSDSPIESPIEKYMFLALMMKAHQHADSVIVTYDGWSRGIQIHPTLSIIDIEPQASIGDYRVDFLITWIETHYEKYEKPGTIPRQISNHLVVECDGHDYHEKTKEQARKDKQRDRELQRCGYHVFRFAGSEIWQNVLQCAESAISFLERKSREGVYLPNHTSG